MLTSGQLSDLTRLLTLAELFATDVTIIGATALQCFMDLPRFTYDIDLVVALDLDRFAEFTGALRLQGWNGEERPEHRWRAPSGSLVDLIPAGPLLLAAREVIWPESNFTMSLLGFHHVFSRAVETNLGAHVSFDVAPPAVIALLKMIAYLDDQQRRRKDLDDLRILFRWYEKTSDRIFSDEVFEADLEDAADANAFLLGRDIGVFATEEEETIVRRFINVLQIPAEELAELDPGDFRQRETQRFQQGLRAFSQGFLASRSH